jgi:FixJ family two-component response regulator
MQKLDRNPSGVIGVVDDDTRVLESLEELLESGGHSVRLYSSASSLFNDGRIDELECLISDVSMPITDGFTLQELLKNTHPDLPVILISGRHDTLLHKRPESIAEPLLFEKPFDGRSLLAAVSNAVNAKRMRG